jgi:S-adenosylmethionine:diacylglycerol 3-amino-3-carboxypropyl transferase
VEDAFDAVIASPWEGLRYGLALGGEAFVDRMHRLIEKKSGLDEFRWVTRVENGEARQVTARKLAERQEERSWQVWVRVHLGGERRIDVARDLGYKDGSAITQILKRLERSSQTELSVRSRMATLKTENEKLLSRIKS